MNDVDAEAPDRDGAPRWLDEREREAWLETAVLITRLPAALDAQLQRDSQISFFEYQVLSMLSMAPDRTRRMSDLAALTSSSLSRLSHVVSRLEGRGLVARARCEGEAGRATNAALTEAGMAKVVEAAPGHVSQVRDLLIDRLSPDQLVALAGIGSVVRRRMDPAGTFDRTHAADEEA